MDECRKDGRVLLASSDVLQAVRKINLNHKMPPMCSFYSSITNFVISSLKNTSIIFNDKFLISASGKIIRSFYGAYFKVTVQFPDKFAVVIRQDKPSFYTA